MLSGSTFSLVILLENRSRPAASMHDTAPNGESSGEGAASPARLRAPLSRAETEFARELFERHQLSLYRYLRGLLASTEDAKEVLQETYLRLLRQPSFERLRANARAYLFQTATNLARDLFRRRSAKSLDVEAEMFAASGLDSPNWASWPEFALEGEQAGQIIIAALEELDTKVRAALLLSRYGDLAQAEIASRLGVSERTVERYIKEGLARIASRLEAES